MARQANYQTVIGNEQDKRPIRYTDTDYGRIFLLNKQILFGTTTYDNVEIWFYRPRSEEIVASIRLSPEDPALSIASVVDTTGVHEFVNINFQEVATRLGIPQGRYSVTCNFFQDEVGTLDGYQLKIDEISSDRTEVKATLVAPNAEQMNDVYEFIVPAVPKLYAQAYTDQLFGKNLDPVPGEEVSVESILSRINSYVALTKERIDNSGSMTAFSELVEEIKYLAYDKAINNIIEDTANRSVQEADLERYLDEAVTETILELRATKQIDPRFVIT